MHIGEGVIRTTFNHPWYVLRKGWVPAGKIEIGDELRCENGQFVVVTDLFANGDVEPVFNLRVADNHTYFVASEGGPSVLVHNQSPGTPVYDESGKLIMRYGKEKDAGTFKIPGTDYQIRKKTWHADRNYGPYGGWQDDGEHTGYSLERIEKSETPGKVAL